jgi:lambda family phage portal protein
MGLVDKLAKRFGYVKPQKRSYNGANVSRLTSDWLSPSTTADEEIRRDLKKLRGRCRELERNNDYVRRYLDGMENNVLGAHGIGLQMKVMDQPGHPDRFANFAIEKAWNTWGRANNCTPTGKMTWRDFQRLALRSCARDGDVLVRMIRGYRNPFGFALQIIEADRLDSEHNQALPDGNEIRMGVEVDPFGKPVAYHILESHPGDTYAASYRKRHRIPANEIIHIFNQERISQTRGVPWMVSAMTRLQQLAGYEEAEVVAARVSSCKMGWLLKENSEGYTGEEDPADLNVLMEAEPGTIEELPSGMKFQEWNPSHPTTAYKDFVKTCLRGISAGLGVSYNMLANDLEGVNYSSIRAGVLEEREHFKKVQQWFTDSFVSPVFESWLESSILANHFPFNINRFDKMNAPQWKPRRWAWVDPLKDLQANVQAVEAGLKSRRSIVAESGGDVEDVFDQIAMDKQLAEEKGLAFGDDLKQQPETVPLQSDE